MCHCLDLQLSAAGGTAGMAGFQVDNPQRVTSPEVFGAAPVGMLPEAALGICGYSGVERVV